MKHTTAMLFLLFLLPGVRGLGSPSALSEPPIPGAAPAETYEARIRAAELAG